MNMRTTFIALGGLVAVVASALGWAGALSSPQLGFPESTPEATREKVVHYLIHQFTFVKGNFINEFTTQTFSGSATNLNTFIGLLHSEGKFDLRIGFAEFEDDRIVLAVSERQGGRENHAHH